MSETVKVRIAVAVDPDGDWNANGWSSADDDRMMMDLVVDTLKDGEARYWVEAELPIPKADTIQGRITPEAPRAVAQTVVDAAMDYQYSRTPPAPLPGLAGPINEMSALLPTPPTTEDGRS